MAWNICEDEEHYRAAHALQREIGDRWLVMWGPGSRAFWAFHRGPARIAPCTAPTPQRLRTAIGYVETTLVADREL